MRGKPVSEIGWSYFYLVVAIVGETVGTSALAAANSFSNLRPSLLAVGGYAAALWFLSLALRTMQTGIAYAIWSGIGIILVSAISWIVFRQRLDVPAIIGILLIMVGVAVVNTFSTSIHR